MISISGIIFLVLFIIILYLQIGTTYLVFQGDESKNRKFSQLAIIWILPIIGAITVGYFYRESQVSHRQPTWFFWPLSSLFSNHSDDLRINRDEFNHHGDDNDNWTDV